jgi:hypothetical protein
MVLPITGGLQTQNDKAPNRLATGGGDQSIDLPAGQQMCGAETSHDQKLFETSIASSKRIKKTTLGTCFPSFDGRRGMVW